MIYIFIKAVAAIFFVSIGVMSFAKAQEIDHRAVLERKEKITKTTFFQNLVTGVLTAMGNPYLIVWVVVAIPAITDQTVFSIWDITVIRGAVVATDVIVTWSFCGALLFLHQRLSDSFVIKMRYVSAIAMIMIGLYIFATMTIRSDLREAELLSLATNLWKQS